MEWTKTLAGADGGCGAANNRRGETVDDGTIFPSTKKCQEANKEGCYRSKVLMVHHECKIMGILTAAAGDTLTCLTRTTTHQR